MHDIPYIDLLETMRDSESDDDDDDDDDAPSSVKLLANQALCLARPD